MVVPTDREEFIARYRFTTVQGALCGPRVIRAAILRALRHNIWTENLSQEERVAHANKVTQDDMWLRRRAGQTPSSVGREAADILASKKFEAFNLQSMGSKNETLDSKTPC